MIHESGATNRTPPLPRHDATAARGAGRSAVGVAASAAKRDPDRQRYGATAKTTTWHRPFKIDVGSIPFFHATWTTRSDATALCSVICGELSPACR